MIKTVLLALILAFSPQFAKAQFAAQQTWCAGACIGGTANAITLAIPNVTSLGDLVGVPIRVKIVTPNTTFVTVAVGGAPVANLLKMTPAGLSALIGGELAPGVETLVFDGTEFVLQTGAAPPLAIIAPLTYYVATTGSDSNSCLTIAAPCLTVQRAISAAQSINMNGFSVTINVANGAYQPFVLGPLNGSGSVSIIGNTATPSNVTISAASGPAIYAVAPGYIVEGMQLSSAANSSTLVGACVYATGSLVVEISDISFGSCFYSDILAQFSASVAILGADEGFPSSYTNIIASAPSFVVAVNGGTVSFAHSILNITGNLTFASGFVTATAGASVSGAFSSINITGSVSGPKFAISLNGIINTTTGNTSYLPGSTSGTITSGGQYF